MGFQKSRSTKRMQVHNSVSVSLRRCQWVPELSNLQNIERKMIVRIPVSVCRFLCSVGSKCAKGPAATEGGSKAAVVVGCYTALDNFIHKSSTYRALSECKLPIEVMSVYLALEEAKSTLQCNWWEVSNIELHQPWVDLRTVNVIAILNIAAMNDYIMYF
ncbi:hypothetical protein C5167_007695 [Papaver somniferum]|nr:hypothetical protein C5167_007695 [Papaver somniferum]